MRQIVRCGVLVGLVAFGSACVEPVAAPENDQIVRLAVSGRYGWEAEAEPSKPLRVERANDLIRSVTGAADIVDADGTRLRVVVDVQALGEGTIGSIEVTNLETGRQVGTPVAADPKRVDIDDGGRWHVQVVGNWASVYRGSLTPFSITLDIDTGPITPVVGVFTCDRLDALVAVAPGLINAPVSQTLTSRGTSTLQGCRDGSTNLTGTIDLTLRFAQLSCAYPQSYPGAGEGTIRWSDGSQSAITVFAVFSGTGSVLTLTIESGRFDGASGNIESNESTIEVPTCDAVPQTRLGGRSLPVTFTASPAAA